MVRIGGPFFHRLVGRPVEQSSQHAKVHDRSGRVWTRTYCLLPNSLLERCLGVYEAREGHGSRGCGEHLGMDGESLTIRPRARHETNLDFYCRTFHTAFSGTDSHLSPFKYTLSRSASPGTCAVHGKPEEPRKLSKDAFLPFILSHSTLNPSKLARQYQVLLSNFTVCKVGRGTSLGDACRQDFLNFLGVGHLFFNSRHKVNFKFFKIYFSI